MVAFNLGRIEDGLQLLDALADGVDGVVLILEVGRIVIVEVHVDVLEVVGPAGLFLEHLELLHRLLDRLDSGVGIIAALVRLPGAIGHLIDIDVDILVQGHPLRLSFLPGLLLGFALLGLTGLGIDNSIDNLPHLLFRDGFLVLESRIKIPLDRIHLDCQIGIGLTEVVQSRAALLGFVPGGDINRQCGSHLVVDVVLAGLQADEESGITLLLCRH